jgi:hypothetical protein
VVTITKNTTPWESNIPKVKRSIQPDKKRHPLNGHIPNILVNVMLPQVFKGMSDVFIEVHEMT